MTSVKSFSKLSGPLEVGVISLHTVHYLAVDLYTGDIIKCPY